MIFPTRRCLLADRWSLDFTCQTVFLFTQVHTTVSLSLSPAVFLLSLSPRRACCSAFGDSACYRGHADECRSILTPKPQHPSGSCVCVCVCVCVCARCVYGPLCVHICWCMSKMFGTQDRHKQVLLSFNSLCPWGCHLPLHGYAGVFVCVRVCVYVCVRMMDLAISLWGIIWTASAAIFLYEYFTII